MSRVTLLLLLGLAAPELCEGQSSNHSRERCTSPSGAGGAIR